jgi:hypothetical protein
MKKPLYKLVVPVLALPRVAKRMVALLVDFSLCVLTVWLAFYLRLGEFVSMANQSQWHLGLQWAAVASVGLALPIFTVSGFYRALSSIFVPRQYWI